MPSKSYEAYRKRHPNRYGAILPSSAKLISLLNGGTNLLGRSPAVHVFNYRERGVGSTQQETAIVGKKPSNWPYVRPSKGKPYFIGPKKFIGPLNRSKPKSKSTKSWPKFLKWYYKRHPNSGSIYKIHNQLIVAYEKYKSK